MMKFYFLFPFVFFTVFLLPADVRGEAVDNQNFLRNVQTHQHTTTSLQHLGSALNEGLEKFSGKVAESLIKALNRKLKEKFKGSSREELVAKLTGFIQANAKQTTLDFDDLLAQIFGSSEHLKQILLDALKKISLKGLGAILPSTENFLATSFMPPTSPRKVYNEILKKILVDSTNQLETLANVKIDDAIFDTPRGPDFDINKMVIKKPEGMEELENLEEQEQEEED